MVPLTSLVRSAAEAVRRAARAREQWKMMEAGEHFMVPSCGQTHRHSAEKGGKGTFH